MSISFYIYKIFVLIYEKIIIFFYNFKLDVNMNNSKL